MESKSKEFAKITLKFAIMGAFGNKESLCKRFNLVICPEAEELCEEIIKEITKSDVYWVYEFLKP